MKYALIIYLFMLSSSCVLSTPKAMISDPETLREPAQLTCDGLFSKSQAAVSADSFNQFKDRFIKTQDFAIELNKLSPKEQEVTIQKIVQLRRSQNTNEKSLFDALIADTKSSIVRNDLELFKLYFGPGKLSFNEIVSAKDQTTIFNETMKDNNLRNDPQFFKFVVTKAELDINKIGKDESNYLDAAFYVENGEWVVNAILKRPDLKINESSPMNIQFGLGDYLSQSINRDMESASLLFLKNRKFNLKIQASATDFKKSYLKQAVKRSQVAVVRELLKRKEVIEILNEKNSRLEDGNEFGDGKTVVHMAFEIDINSRREDRKYDQQQMRDMIFDILEAPGADINSRDNHGNTPIYYLSHWRTMMAVLEPVLLNRSGDIDGRIPNRILKQNFKVDINQVNIAHRETALQHHIRNTNFDAALILLKHPEINSKNKNESGKTALDQVNQYLMESKQAGLGINESALNLRDQLILLNQRP